MSRRIGARSAFLLVVASMIGSGVFTISGFALAELGAPGPVLLAWALGGALAACGALSYGVLGRHYPVSGGEYALLARLVHPFAGFLAGWVSLLAGFTAPIAAAALGVEAYLHRALDLGLPPRWLATGAVLAAGLAHGVRPEVGVAVQDAAVVLKLLLMAGLIALGTPRLLAAPVQWRAGFGSLDLAEFGTTLAWVGFAYSGWNAALYLAGELRDPERSLPRALILATGCVTVLYLALNAIFLAAAPASQLAGQAEIGAIAAQALGGSALRRAVAALVALALFTAILSMVMAGPRVTAQMACEGLLPAALAPRRDAPSAATLLQVALAIAALWLADLAQLLSYVGLALSLCAAATVAAGMAQRMREGERGVRLPGHPLVPGLFVAASLAVAGFLAARDPLGTAIGLATIAAGALLYRPGRWRPAALGEARAME